MGIFSSKQYVEIAGKQIGNSGDHWTTTTCPPPFLSTSNQCYQIGLTNPAFAMERCNNLSNCVGFDYNYTTNSAYFHTNNSITGVNKNNNAYILTNVFNWKALIIIIAVIILLILIIIVIILFLKKK